MGKVFERLLHRIPLIEGKRIMLRRIMPGDAESMFAYSRLPEVTRYLLWEPHPNLEHTKRYIAYLQEQYHEKNFFDWAIVLNDSRKMIGTCGFVSVSEEHKRGEIGYVLAPEYWGKGYACEALALALQFGFDSLSLHRIEARCFEENHASARVMEKCGLHYEGTARDGMYIKGRYATIKTYAILEDEFLLK